MKDDVDMLDAKEKENTSNEEIEMAPAMTTRSGMSILRPSHYLQVMKASR